MLVSMPHAFVDMGTLEGFPNPPATLRCRRSRQAPHATNPPNTSQPPWKSSTRAAGVPRPCWLSWSIYVKRLSLTVGRIGTPACAGAWEDKQQLELKPCCLPPFLANHVPNSIDSVSSDLSYRYSRDLVIIPEPQPRHSAPSPTTLLSGLAGPSRRNLQG